MKKTICMLLVCLLTFSILFVGCKKDPPVTPTTESTENGAQDPAGNVTEDQPKTDPTLSEEDLKKCFAVVITVEGRGQIASSEISKKLVFDVENPTEEIRLNVFDTARYTIAAKPYEGAKFVKWLKNGEDYSTDSAITMQFTEDTRLIAVFEDE